MLHPVSWFPLMLPPVRSLLLGLCPQPSSLWGASWEEARTGRELCFWLSAVPGCLLRPPRAELWNKDGTSQGLLPGLGLSGSQQQCLGLWVNVCFVIFVCDNYMSLCQPSGLDALVLMHLPHDLSPFTPCGLTACHWQWLTGCRGSNASEMLWGPRRDRNALPVGELQKAMA